MLIHVTASNMRHHGGAIDAMFRDRKRVFVDTLKWDVPVTGHWECDAFDDAFAEYFIVWDPETDRHLGSMRILRTDRPHILRDLFPQLCASAVPAGPEIRELTRLCLSPDIRASRRRQVRNQLFTALVEHALCSGIQAYTGVAEMSWFAQLLALGWRTTPLGLPMAVNGQVIAAAIAHIDGETPALFREAGTYAPLLRPEPLLLPDAA